MKVAQRFEALLRIAYVACLKPVQKIPGKIITSRWFLKYALIEQFVSRGKILSRTLDELEHVLANGYVALQEELVVGFVTLEIYSHKLAEIRSLVVDDTMQGQGIGRRLVETCVERARERGVFEVMAVSSSEDFFRTCGFDFTLPGEKKAFFLQTRPKHT